MNTNTLNRAHPRRLRSVFLPLLFGLGLGAGSTLLFLHLRGNPVGGSELSPFSIAASLPNGDAPRDPDFEKINTAARALADKVVELITLKDGNPIAPLCALPFLGGAPHNQRIVSDQADLSKALNGDLCKGPYGPFLYEKKWDTSMVLDPSAFHGRFSEVLAGQAQLRELIGRLQLTPSDRVVVESHRGMLLFVREQDGQTRLIGIIPLGFRDFEHQFKLTRDVIYGRKYGTSLTLDVLQPLEKANGAALLQLNNGDFISPPKRFGEGISLPTQTLLNAGYTVIYVTPSGTPKHTIPEALADVQRAVRFVRFNARRLNLDPGRLAIMGSSSGGYLAQMTGLWTEPAPTFPPESDPVSVTSKSDPVEAVSSRVQAVIAYYGPTDWLNFGEPGKTVLDKELPVFRSHIGIFDQYEFDPSRYGFQKIADRERQLQELKKLSPINLVSSSAAPMLIFQGDKDENVPLEQAEKFHDALTKAGATSELVVKRGEGHGWSDNPEDCAKIIEWLDRHLKTQR